MYGRDLQSVGVKEAGTMDDDDDKIKHQTADFVRMRLVLCTCNKRCLLVWGLEMFGFRPSNTVPGSGMTAEWR